MADLAAAGRPLRRTSRTTVNAPIELGDGVLVATGTAGNQSLIDVLLAIGAGMAVETVDEVVYRIGDRTDRSWSVRPVIGRIVAGEAILVGEVSNRRGHRSEAAAEAD
ncbi:MAG: hypothetical protein KJO18_05205 [Acidimicrobiia bacterium]|nr:hypothetical protein [Acidimicrobiia bacterium]